MTENARDAASSRPPSRPPARTTLSLTVVAALTVLTQIILRRELAPGEFGTMNALFGVVIVLLMPLAAFSAVLRRELTAAGLADLHATLLNRAAVAWGIVCLVALFVVLSPLQLPRTSLEFFTLLAVACGLLAICGRPATPAKWCAIIGISAAALRLVVSASAGNEWPSAESGLGALLLAALLAGLPALRGEMEAPHTAEVRKALRPALVPALATISVVFALALFTNADRIAAQPNLGTPDPEMSATLIQIEPKNSNAALRIEQTSGVDYGRFDDYQTAGLCARGLLWALLPMLGVMYVRRAPLSRTTYASLHWFWIYLAALFVGAGFLFFGSPIVNALFVPHYPRAEKIDQTSLLLMNFTVAFLLLGLLQGIAVFALASRRYVECFTLAVCSLAYTAFVFEAGHRANIMIGYMAGGALISLMLVLFVGVVRYARSHP